MFEPNDEKFLLQALGQNRVVLFAGAGFSRTAKNSLGEPMPLGRDFASTLWSFQRYPGPYDGTPLKDLYEALLTSGKSHADMRALLEAHLLCAEIPKDFEVIPKIFWHRIYTTNVDNLITEIYRHSGVETDVMSFPRMETRERDQSLEKFQVVYLNGRLPCRPEDVTFTARQYARRAGPHDPLYELFVGDYATKPTIFVGTELDEPLFFQYIEARARRASAGIDELRPRSFLISPHISPPKRDSLRKAFNIVSIEADTQIFLNWLAQKIAALPTRIDVLKSTLPGLVEILQAEQAGGRFIKELKHFGLLFHHVPIELEGTGSGEKSLFLLGASPRWEDILRDMDAPRAITDVAFQKTEETLRGENRLKAYMLLGPAGSGKSTILRRLGIRLSRSGYVVYLTNSEENVAPQIIARSLEAFDKRVVLLFDNAETVLGGIPRLLKELRTVSKAPVVIVAARTNDYDRKISRLVDDNEVEEISVPNLNRPEIEALIRTLETNNLLGELRGKAQSARIAAFEDRANKQILIAMREATSGEKFNDILKNEFGHLEPQEAKILYLCVALATDAGYRITRQEFVGCSEVVPAETLHILDRTLKQIVVATGPSDDLLMLRHRLIAEYMVDQAAPRSLLREAYLRILAMLASQIRGVSRRSRAFGFYRDVINHYTIYRRFEENVDEARSIYDSLTPRFQEDSQFWLQYGSLELEGGNLQFAENYLKQADSLDPGNAFILNAIGHLYFRKAVRAASKAESLEYRDRGAAILLEHIERIGKDEAYCFHIYGVQRLNWIRRWAESDDERLRELDSLRQLVRKGTELHPRDKRLKDAAEDVEREYLAIAVPR